ncbi:MAG: methionyl-tRNA formyltransferase [Gammaproteobacteria bacterium]|nr:methionyl-tRNA formyltransferase [Gammaproteobacteria bacterium]
MRIIYAGSPEFAVSALEALIHSEHEVVAVLTQPDRPAGRGRKLTPPPVKAKAEAHGLTVLQPETLRGEAIQQQLQALQPDCMVVVAYGLILPQVVLDIPTFGCLNLHASLLPKYRGAAPVQAAILSGDHLTGVCLMQMDAGLDTGPVLLRQTTDIGSYETTGELTLRLAEIGAEVLMKGLPELASGALRAELQPAAGASYAGKIKKAEATIDWTLPASEIVLRVRAFNPWPVAQTILHGKQLRCWRAIADDCPIDQGMPGEIVELSTRGLVVQTGLGLLILQEVQQPGKSRCDIRHLPGVELLPGTLLGV